MQGTRPHRHHVALPRPAPDNQRLRAVDPVDARLDDPSSPPFGDPQCAATIQVRPGRPHLSGMAARLGCIWEIRSRP